MDVLIAEAHERTKHTLVQNLKKYNYNVLETENGEGVLEIVKNFLPKILIIDINIPNLNGISLCSIIKKNPAVYGTPYIITLAAMSKSEYNLESLESGADNYLKKPYNDEEIILKINAISKRITHDYKPSINKNIKFKNIQIDLSDELVKENGKYTSVTKREYDLLHYMIINKNLTLTRKKIISNIWNNDCCNERIVDVYIKRLRNKLKSIGNDIVTIKGLGYKLEA